MQTFSNDIMSKAVMIDMQTKMNAVYKKIEASNDLVEIAALFNQMAQIALETKHNLEGLGETK